MKVNLQRGLGFSLFEFFGGLRGHLTVLLDIDTNSEVMPLETISYSLG